MRAFNISGVLKTYHRKANHTGVEIIVVSRRAFFSRNLSGPPESTGRCTHNCEIAPTNERIQKSIRNLLDLVKRLIYQFIPVSVSHTNSPRIFHSCERDEVKSSEIIREIVVESRSETFRPIFHSRADSSKRHK